MTPSLDIAQKSFRPLARTANPGDFWSADPGEVSDYVGARFTPHRLNVTDSGCTAVELRSLALRSASFYTVQYNKDVTIDGVAGPDHYFMQTDLPIARSKNGSHYQEPGTFHVISPGDYFQLSKRAHLPSLIVKIDRNALEARFRAHHHSLTNGPIRFDPVIYRENEISSFVRETVAHIAYQINHFPHLASVAQIETHYVSILAEIFLKLQHNYGTSLDTPRHEILPWHVRRAKDLIENSVSIGFPVAISDLATEIGVSVRTLQSGFQRFLGKSPNHFIRSLKLEMLHSKLSTAQPNARVTDLMTECGIYDFGRFARLYRMYYGRMPSEELRGPRH